MSNLHVNWGPALQPATRYRIAMPDADWRQPPRYRWVTCSPHQLGRCFSCGRRRRLRHLNIREQAWYDPTWHCRPSCPPTPKRRQGAT